MPFPFRNKDTFLISSPSATAKHKPTFVHTHSYPVIVRALAVTWMLGEFVGFGAVPNFFSLFFPSQPAWPVPLRRGVSSFGQFASHTPALLTILVFFTALSTGSSLTGFLRSRMPKCLLPNVPPQEGSF